MIRSKQFEKEKKNHKKGLSSFEINAPKAHLKLFEPYIVHGYKAEYLDICFTKHKGDDASIQKIDRLMIENFERECGDLFHMTQSDTIYLMISSVLSPGMVKTEDYRYVGVLHVHDDIMQVVWIHPFLRNKGFMTDFMLYYGRHENMWSFQPPIMKTMQGCLKKLQGIVIKNPEFIAIQAGFTLKFLIKKCPHMLSEISCLSIEEIGQIRAAIELFQAQGLDVRMKIELPKIIELNVKFFTFIRSNPQVKEDLKEWAEKNIDKNEFDIIRSKFLNEGADWAD